MTRHTNGMTYKESFMCFKTHEAADKILTAGNGRKERIMSIKFEIEKIIRFGEQWVKINSCEMLSNSELPNEYKFGGGSAIYKDAEGDLRIKNTEKDFCFYLLPGLSHTYQVKHAEKMDFINPRKHGLMKKADLELLVQHCKNSGQRLREINKRLREENKNWKGTSTIEI